MDGWDGNMDDRVKNVPCMFVVVNRKTLAEIRQNFHHQKKTFFREILV